MSGGRVGTLAGGASFKAFPMPVEARDWEDIGRDSEGNLWSPTSATTSATAPTPPC